MDNSTPTSGREPADLVGLTVDLLSAYVANNTVPFAELPGLVGAVHAAMTQLGQPYQAPAEVHTPAVPVKKSITPDALISLIDGKPYRTLKRHLSGHGLTPAAYRERYNLPADYPMAAASYSAQRAALAKRIGLGARGRGATAVPTEESRPAADAPAEEVPPPKRGGARRKAAAKSASNTSAETAEQATPKRRSRRAKA